VSGLGRKVEIGIGGGVDVGGEVETGNWRFEKGEGGKGGWG